MVAVYWCLPLTNLVCDFGSQLTPEISAHPLRIEYSDRSNQPYSSLTRDYIQEKRVIPFMMLGRPCFIQPEHDYGDIVHALRKENLRSEVTAYAIGPLDDVLTKAVLENDLTTRLSLLLSIGSGNDVGSTGLTKYSEDGEYMGWTVADTPASYFDSRNAVHKKDQGMSHLLSEGLASAFSQSSTFRVASRMFIRSGDNHLVVEERLALLFRALERLCDDEEYRHQHQPEMYCPRNSRQR